MSDKMSKVKYAVLIIVGLYILYLLLAGLVTSSSYTQPYRPEQIPASAPDQHRAIVLASAVGSALDGELKSMFGLITNDLMFVPVLIDNRAAFQKGVIYATRQASDVVGKNAARYGDKDTIDQRLADASSRFFPYSENVWGWWFIYDCEGKYRNAINNWLSWATSVGTEGKNAGIYNLRSDDIYSILRFCVTMTDYALGILNDDQVGHFSTDNNIYYAKGIALVTGNILRAINAVDGSVAERGGAENVEEALRRFEYINEFDPLLVMAGGNVVGDAMIPNHVAALARHIDIANNRMNDMLSSMEK